MQLGKKITELGKKYTILDWEWGPRLGPAGKGENPLNMVDLQVQVYFQHAHPCCFHVLFTDELGLCLFTLKNPHLQKN